MMDEQINPQTSARTPLIITQWYTQSYSSYEEELEKVKTNNDLD